MLKNTILTYYFMLRPLVVFIFKKSRSTPLFTPLGFTISDPMTGHSRGLLLQGKIYLRSNFNITN